MLDLTALSRAVSAVLDAHGVPASQYRCRANTAMDEFFVDQSPPEGGSAIFRVDVRYSVAQRWRALVSGEITAVSVAVMATVWKHIKGEGEA